MGDELLTILFTDLEGSTALYSAKGDAEAREVLAAIDELARRHVSDHGGRPIKSLGDGLMAVFASPRRAVACALAIQSAVAEHGERRPDQRVRVRAGLHTGEVTEADGDLAGEAVAAAARICAKAKGGEVLGSEVIRQVCGSLSDTTFEVRGRVALKGFPERWRLYRIVPANAARTTPVPPGDPTPFVGREVERAELRRLMDRAAAGQGGLVMIGGEPGVGKSRLCEEIATEARQRFRVFVGHCYESGRDLPYMPWVEVIETAMRETAPDELREALGDDASELARLVPQLRRLFPDLPPPVEVPPEQQRRYIFNSVRECVTRLSAVRPRLYVLEDLHWADESTLLLLEHLAERLSSISCLIVGTYRDPPIDVSPQLGETLSNLVRRRQVRLLSLKRHSEAEVEALLRVLSGQPPPHGVYTAIYGETEGNVFFVEEVFRHLTESGRLLDEKGRFRQDISIGELDVPDNVRLVTDRRLERLGEATRQTLSIAAVAGRHVGSQLLQGVAEAQGDELIDALDEAERARLIVTESVGEDEEYWFAHELIRQTLLTRLPAARRRQYHLRVADAMERGGANDVSTQAATIAQHLIEAGASADKARLFRYLVVAGKQALEAAAFEDALRHFRRAASLGDEAAPAERAEMCFQLGMAQRSAGHWSDAIHPWHQALEIQEREGDAEAVGRTCLAAAYSLAWAARWVEGSEMAQRGLVALRHRVSADRARLLAMSAFAIAGAGHYHEGMEQIAEALSLAEALDDRTLLGDVLCQKAMIHHVYMEMQGCVDAGLRGAEIMRTAGELWRLAAILGFVCQSLVCVGRLDDARRVAKEVNPLAERLGNHPAVLQAGRAAALADFFETGNVEALEAFGRRDVEFCERARLPWGCHAWSWLAAAEFLAGSWEEAVRDAETADLLSAPSPLVGSEWAFHLECRAYAGQREEALAMLEAPRVPLPRSGQANGWGQWVVLLALVESLIVLGERERAATLYPLVRECVEHTGVASSYLNEAVLVERIAGMAAAAGARWDAAEAHFTIALEQANALPHRPEQAHTRRWYGRFLVERGGANDLDRARGLLEEAAAGYASMGMPRHEEMARELLAPAGTGP